MDQDHIDSLLASLLNLVHEYEALQLELSKLTSGVHLNLAKANFAGERGMRYDADHFNGAMRATRGIKITDGEDGVPVFTYKKLDSPSDEEDQEEDEKQEDSPEGDSAAAQENSEASPEGKDEDKEEQDKKKTKKVNRDPLNRFGLLVPAPLREAKSLSIQMVEQIIPRIASIKARIADVEIEIRRAKKKRAKAEAEAAAAAAAAAQAEKEAAEAS